ncbi:MAG: class I SAM-dependent methyltransferase [Xanthobacteraceae bacterium]
MDRRRHLLRLALVLLVFCVAAVAAAQESTKPYEPVPGQSGKDSVWVPTPNYMLDKMFEVVRLTPQDFVIDLGSGDGRTVIAAAKRGARALGIEFNPKLVALSQQRAEKAGVADRATFVEGDMFTADLSKATVLALFMLPDQLAKLAPKFLTLRPGTRIVLNTFSIPKWDADQTRRIGGRCKDWCTVLLYVVPAKVAGTWRLGEGELTFQQTFQKVTGTLASADTRRPIADARLRGDTISFRIGGSQYSGRVNGNTMTGRVKGRSTGTWTATRE